MRGLTLRRHADGALDIGYHRRRARRLRGAAQRQACRAAACLLRRASPAPLGWIAAALLVCGAALAEPPSHRSELLEMAVRPDGRVFRLVALQLAPGAATAPHRLAGESIMLVIEGSVTRDAGDGEPVSFGPGRFLDASGVTHVLRNNGTATARLLVGSIAPADEPPLHPSGLSE